jgi:Mn2+/Fe2+ NRAMP family transporter
MKKLLEITLGIITSIGGFLEVGSIATSTQAGAEFGFRLIWVIVLGTLCLMFLVEMSGRLAAVSKHTIIDAIRERFGARYFTLLLLLMLAVILLVLGSEIGGVCLALQLVTGISFQWWALPVAFAIWLLLWKGTFGVVEKGAALLGLVTVVFLVAALKLHPSWTKVAAGLLPGAPGENRAHYWFVAVSILGASISPYLFFFYSAGAIEDKWNESHIPINRVIAGMGMSFGGLLAAAVLVVAALVLQPPGVQIERYEQVPLMLTQSLGRWGFRLFAASLGIACFGAALEIALAMAYMVAQGFGWNWGENEQPKDDARFSLTYTASVFLGALLMVIGIDPLKLTNFSMALTAATLPVGVVPFLIVMNDQRYLRTHRNGVFSNVVVTVIVVLAFVLALVSIPLEFFGS